MEAMHRRGLEAEEVVGGGGWRGRWQRAEYRMIGVGVREAAVAEGRRLEGRLPKPLWVKGSFRGASRRALAARA